MHGSGGLDIRLPIGGLFTLLGLMLAGYGFAKYDFPGKRILFGALLGVMIGARCAHPHKR